MDNLPLDLLRPIIENLADDSRSLLAVSLASRQLRVEGQRILFRKVAPLMVRVRHAKFLNAIISSSLLASLVEEYHQFNVNHREYHEPFWRLTCRGLQAMVNLKIFRFRMFAYEASAEIFHGCTFQLEVLHWSNDGELIFDFLQTQPQLHTLRVYWRHPELDTSGICPGLQVLDGDLSTINAFLPGRRVTSLIWTPNKEERLLNDSIDHLSEKFQHIRFFSFGGTWGRPRFDRVIGHLRAIEVLELVGLESLAVPVCLRKFLCDNVHFLINHPGTSISFRHPHVTNSHPLPCFCV